MSERFDLVLLDIMMPGLDGIEVLKRIRLRHSPLALPVIMVTAKNESEDVVESLELGANDYICKPVSLPVALARVEVQIARKRTQEELIRANGDLDRYVRQLLVANPRLEVEAARARVA